MYKVGVCGHFGFGKDFADGQTDKTKAVWRALTKTLGEDQVLALDTYGWKKNPVSLFVNCYKLIKKCENVIMLPASGGVNVFPALFEAMNRNFNRRLHYIVIGGWLPEKLSSNTKLLSRISKLDKVYVELQPMREALLNLGLKNVIYMPNFRETHSLTEKELVYSDNEPYRLCTFSRVARSKGIEEAVEAVRTANRALGRVAFTLDIFGRVDLEYAADFEKLRAGFEPFIQYKGCIDTDLSTDVLKVYYALLFPTVYPGEGFAGTVIDAFSAGVPVIATDWNYNSHIIRKGVDGIIYAPQDKAALSRILADAAKNPQLLSKMKPECLKRAGHFDADKGVKILLRELEMKQEVAGV